MSKGNFFDIYILSQDIEYWINFQNIEALDIKKKKTLLHALLFLVFKIVKSLQCILNSSNFTTPSSRQRFQFMKKKCCLRFKIRWISKYWVLINAFWILLSFVRFRFVRYRFRFVRRSLQYMSLRRLEDVLEDENLLCWSRVEDVFKTCLMSVRHLQDVLKSNKCLLCFLNGLFQYSFFLNIIFQ